MGKPNKASAECGQVLAARVLALTLLLVCGCATVPEVDRVGKLWAGEDLASLEPVPVYLALRNAETAALDWSGQAELLAAHCVAFRARAEGAACVLWVAGYRAGDEVFAVTAGETGARSQGLVVAPPQDWLGATGLEGDPTEAIPSASVRVPYQNQGSEVVRIDGKAAAVDPDLAVRVDALVGYRWILSHSRGLVAWPVRLPLAGVTDPGGPSGHVSPDTQLLEALYPVVDSAAPLRSVAFTDGAGQPLGRPVYPEYEMVEPTRLSAAGVTFEGRLEGRHELGVDPVQADGGDGLLIARYHGEEVRVAFFEAGEVGYSNWALMVGDSGAEDSTPEEQAP